MKTTLIFLLCAFPVLVSGQKDKSFELGVFGGVSYYNGDINPHRHLHPEVISPAYGLVIRENFNRRWSLKGQVYFGRLKGDDSQIDSDYHQERNLSFSSPLWEAGGQIEFNFIPFHPLDVYTFPVTPYAFIGFSMFRFNPTTELQGNTYELQPLRTEGQDRGYRRVQPAVPFGFGLKTRLSHRFLIGFEWGIRRTWTDYIDDVSGFYPQEGELDGIAADLSDRSFEQVGPGGNNWGTQRGNSKNKDWYTFTGLTLTMRIGPPPNSCFFDPLD